MPRSPSNPAIGIRRTSIGKTTKSASIDALDFLTSGAVTLILAGMHGDEPKSVFVARKLLEHLDAHPPVGSVIIVPVVNPDGYALRRRGNAHRVDLNRNFPTQNWQPGRQKSRYYPGAESEPETRAVIRLIERVRPRRIITIHSIDRNRFCNNYDGPAKRIASAMARRNGYPVAGDIGYPTPGSLGTYAGVERRIPTVTLELPSHHSPKRCWQDNAKALLWCCR